MSKLIIHKNITSKTLFRVTGANMYNRPGWDIAINKEEVIAYFTQFQPDIITIGHIDNMNTIQIAEFIKFLYSSVKIAYPIIFLVHYDDLSTIEKVKQIFGNKFRLLK